MNYSFPYIKQNDFNHEIYFISPEEFHSLLFYCPICTKNFRHYSMYYHIFQFHFSYVNEFLIPKEIAHGCAKLMEKEYRKIKFSLKLFGVLEILFSECEFFGLSE